MIIDDTISIIGLIVPGIIAGIFTLALINQVDTGLNIYRNASIILWNDYAWEIVLSLLMIPLAVISYAIVSIPISWWAARHAYQACRLEANAEFTKAIRRLEGKQEKVMGSRIFGE